MSETLASFSSNIQTFKDMLDLSVAPLNTDRYDKAYINIGTADKGTEAIRTISNMQKSVVSYCTWYSGIQFEDVTKHDSYGEDEDAEAILNVPKIKDYLSFLDEKEITVSLLGNPDDRLAKKMRVSGEDSNVEFYLSTSDNDLNKMETGMLSAGLFNERDEFVRQSDGSTLDTRIDIHTSEMQRIIDVVDFDGFSLNNYPLTVKDEELLLQTKDDRERNSMSIRLDANDVRGPDVQNTYSRGFGPLFDGKINGLVNIQTEQDGPLVVIYSGMDGMVCRYLIVDSRT